MPNSNFCIPTYLVTKEVWFDTSVNRYDFLFLHTNESFRLECQEMPLSKSEHP